MIDQQTAWAKVRADYEERKGEALGCSLGDQLIVHPEGAVLTPPAFYILGFNGGETAKDGAAPPSGDTPSAKRWFNICRQAAEAIGVPAWGITERCHWGSPSIPALIQRLGGGAELRRLLALHAEANLAMFRETPPLVVWVTGLGFLAETMDLYRLTTVGDPEPRLPPLKGTLWRQYVADDGVPYLVTRHPTGARYARGEPERVFAKLAELAAARKEVLLQAH